MQTYTVYDNYMQSNLSGLISPKEQDIIITVGPWNILGDSQSYLNPFKLH